MRVLALAALVLAVPALAQPTAPRFDDTVMISYGGAHWLGADYERQVHPALAARAGLGLGSVGILQGQPTATALSVRVLGTVGSSGPSFQAGPGLTFVSGRWRSAGEGVSQTIPLQVVPSLTLSAKYVLSGGNAPGGGPASPPDLAVRAGAVVAYDVWSGQDGFLPHQGRSDASQRALRLRPELSVGFAF